MTTLRGADNEIDDDSNDENDGHDGDDEGGDDAARGVDEDDDDAGNDGRIKGSDIWGIVLVWVHRGRVTSIGLNP